ncbi:MAG TPA: transcriptional regulator, partial [Halomonas sp.]|nr:transcriptional regulator [Halomonas sp.]
NADQEPERKHSSSSEELERGFSSRLEAAIGQRSVLSFAKECGFSDSLVRKYLRGSLPGLDKAVTMARVLGVSLEWLATGKGESSAANCVQEEAAPHTAGQAKLGFNEALLRQVIEAVEEALDLLDLDIDPPGKKADLIFAIYEMYDDTGVTPDASKVIRIVKTAA